MRPVISAAMILPPRTLAIRLFFWTALLAYAIWILRGRSADEVFVADPAPVAVDRRIPLPAPVGAFGDAAPSEAPQDVGAPAVVDIEAAVGAMEAAGSALAACGATGTFSVRLDTDGLAEAWIAPPEGDEAALTPEVQACAARAAWAPAWPRTAQGFEMQRAIP